MPFAFKGFSVVKSCLYFTVCAVLMGVTAPLKAMQDNPSNYLHVTGWVVKDDQPLSNVQITISEDGEVLSAMKTNFAGSFSLFVPFQKEYQVSFSREGHITKNVIIDTQTPVEPDSLFYYFFQFEVELFEDSPYARREFFKDPVAIVFYDAGVHDFEYYRSNVKIFSAKAQNLFKDSLGVAFEYPESFFEYIQSLTEQPEQLHMIADREASAEQPPKDNDGKEMPLNSDSSGQKATDPVASSSSDYPDTREEKENIVTKTALGGQRDETPDNSQPGKAIMFYNYLTKELLDIGPEQFYTIQLLATARSVPEGYFDAAIETLQLQEIIQYRDCDKLHKYTVGVYENLGDAFSVSHQLEEMGYEIFIVAFSNHRRLW